MNQDEPLIRICSLKYSYESSLFSGKMALNGLNLKIYKGESVLVTGPSGSGKSTLLKCITGLIPNSSGGKMSGRVFVDGMDTSRHSVAEISRIAGYVFQNPDHQIVTNEVDSEIAFGPEQAGIPLEEIEKRIEEITKALGITYLRGRDTTQISWGEMQKTAIASVLAMNPKILLMDEPFSGLDESSVKSLKNIISEISRRGITILIIEHRVGILMSAASRLIAMDSGRIVYDGLPADIPPETAEGLDGCSELKSLDTLSKGFMKKSKFYPASAKNEYREPAVRLKNVSYRYPGQKRNALNNVNISFYLREITAVFGANGSGKSTLARHFNGLLKPDEGEVFIFGEDIREKTTAQNSHIVSLVAQHADSQLFEDTIEKELSFGPKNLGFDEGEISRSTGEIMELAGISHLNKSARPLKLSVGEKQRVAIASHLMMRTPVVVMDEPTLGLDWPLKKRLAETLKAMKNEEKCIILITHDRKFAEMCSDNEYIIDDGMIYEIYSK